VDKCWRLVTSPSPVNERGADQNRAARAGQYDRIKSRVFRVMANVDARYQTMSERASAAIRLRARMRWRLTSTTAALVASIVV
jgi:hypothetical protein